MSTNNNTQTTKTTGILGLLTNRSNTSSNIVDFSSYMELAYNESIPHVVSSNRYYNYMK